MVEIIMKMGKNILLNKFHEELVFSFNNNNNNNKTSVLKSVTSFYICRWYVFNR